MDRNQTAIAAIFPDRESANVALDALEHQGFPRPWMAVTRQAEDDGYATSTSANSENEVAESSDGPLGAIGRFFSGEGNSLRRSLEGRGLTPSEAEAVDSSMGAGNAVIVVDGNEADAKIPQIIQGAGGRLSGTASGAVARAPYDETIAYDATSAPAVKGVVSDARGDATKDQRLQLSEERLRVDKAVVSAGEVTIGKRVETERASLDVPVIHEELFIERRPVSGAPTASAFGESETITVPLSREELQVQKTNVVREEVVVGKRRVEETQHIDETLRREVLDEASVARASAATGSTRGPATVETSSAEDTLR